MVKWGNSYFACDECPICQDFERRLELAQEGGYEPQFEYCSCDKIDFSFYCGWYCEDAFIKKPHIKKTGKRKTGRAYRRMMKQKKDADLRKIMNYGYAPHIGYIDWGFVDGVWQPIGTHIKYPAASRKQRYMKRLTSKIARKANLPKKGNGYRKLFDYWWTMY